MNDTNNQNPTGAFPTATTPLGTTPVATPVEPAMPAPVETPAAVVEQPAPAAVEPMPAETTVPGGDMSGGQTTPPTTPTV